MGESPDEKKLMKELREESLGKDISIYFIIILLVVLTATLFVS